MMKINNRPTSICIYHGTIIKSHAFETALFFDLLINNSFKVPLIDTGGKQT